MYSIFQRKEIPSSMNSKVYYLKLASLHELSEFPHHIYDNHVKYKGAQRNYLQIHHSNLKTSVAHLCGLGLTSHIVSNGISLKEPSPHRL